MSHEQPLSVVSRSCRATLSLAALVAVLLLIVRSFVVIGIIVPVRVTSGSMAETLLGPHVEYTCRHCGHRQRWDRTGTASGRQPLTCWQCLRSIETEDGARFVSRAGNRVLVDRVGLAWSPLQRWDVVVFRCPQHASRLCVKRVVGLPGETIEVRLGDLFVNGQRQTKPLAVQRRMRQFIHRETDAARRWQADVANSRWTWSGRAWQFQMAAGDNDEPAWLVYHHPAAQPIYDDVPYNVGHSRRLAVAGDLAISLRVELQPGGRLWLRGGNRQRDFQASLAAAGDLIVTSHAVEAPQQPVVLARREHALGRGPHRVEFSLFDRLLLLVVDEAELVAVPLTADDDGEAPVAEHWSLGASGAATLVRDLTLWRDVAYDGRQPQPWRLGEDKYFVVGDNPPISADSRAADIEGAVPAALVVGRVVGAR